jgi:hypothetical protein
MVVDSQDAPETAYGTYLPTRSTGIGDGTQLRTTNTQRKTVMEETTGPEIEILNTLVGTLE